MSNETLSYLGYEDLSDFTSQHSDFANLLVNKEGYIYKFQNFSWIDFILYSGSPNKSALLQLKNGEPLEIKLSVKEVHLITELGNNSKFYSIRILSDNFVNIAAKTDASITKQSPPKNAFNLNSLITEEESITTNNETNTSMPAVEEPSTTSDFVLNFPSSDSLKEEEAPAKLDLSEPEEKEFVLSMPSQEQTSSDNDFKLNLSDSIFDAQEQSTESSVKVDLSEPEVGKEQVASNQDFTLNFLQEDKTPPLIKEEAPTESVPVEEVALDFLKPTESKNENSDNTLNPTGFKLKHVTEEPKKEQKEGKITLNFLKNETLEESQETMTPPSQKAPEVEANLDFLKQVATPEVQEVETVANKDQIIAQIQNDIKEIDDEVEEESHTFRQEVQEPQKEEIESDDINAYLFNKNKVKKEKKSFTKTLQSLFSETKDLPQKRQEEEYMEVFQAPDAVLKEEEAPRINLTQTEDLHRFPTLASLGLEKEEEDDLIFEFVNDTKENIQLFKDFYKSGNVDQAEYTLIKMQSSANILNLNDIIITLANVKQSCTNGDSETIEELTTTLDAQVRTLESYLESETV